MRNRGFTLIELMLVVMIIGIIASIAVPNFVNIKSRAKEASTMSNTHTLQLAVEDFAVLNSGQYADDVDTHTAPNGATILAMLPGGHPMKNSFTNVATEPVNAVLADSPGEIAYSPVLHDGVPEGYVITAAGKTGEVILKLEK